MYSQVLGGTGSRSLNSAYRRLSCIGRLSVDVRQQQHLAALLATNQPSLETAPLAPHGDEPSKGAQNKTCLTLTWLAICGQRAYLPRGKKNERKKKTASLKVACWNNYDMQDCENHPEQRSALIARELVRLDIDTTALSEVHFAEQRSRTENGAGLGRTRMSTASLGLAS